MRRKLKRPSECTLLELGERYQYNLELQKKYYYINKETQLERNKKWRELNPEKYKESCKAASKRRNLKNRKKPDWVRPQNEEEKTQRKIQGRKDWYQKNKERILNKYKEKKNGK